MDAQVINKLIPELAAWNGGAGVSVRAWVHALGRYDYFFEYSTLFWPDFVLYDGCIFRELPVPGSYRECLDVFQGDKSKVESLLNHLHIADMFLSSTFPLTKEMAAEVGRILQEMWSCKLLRDFPDRKTQVDFYGTDSDNTIDYQITVVQKR